MRKISTTVPKQWSFLEQRRRLSAAALSHEYIRSEAAEKKNPGDLKTAVVLHGMLGNQKNLRQLSTKFAERFENYQMLLITHRAHGMSERGDPPYDLANCSRDLIALLEEENIRKPDMFIGHSFGAKVSVSCLDVMCKEDHAVEPPRVIWSLDCPPGAWATVGVDREHQKTPESQSVEAVIRTLKSLPQPLDSKNQLIDLMTAKGFSVSLAQWLTLNLRPMENGDRKKGGFVWSFDLEIIEQLFESHKRTDLWPILESNWLESRDIQVNFIQAGKNPAWTTDVLERFQSSKNPNVQHILLPNVGHWLHVEAPDAVHNIIAPSFLQ